jgi:hypothetical protein
MFDYAVRKARELAEDYKLHVLNGSASRKCEKQFLWRCQQNLGFNIRVHWLPPDLPTTAMRGTCVRSADGYDIVLLPNMEPTLARFVIVKEIFHAVVLDIEALYKMNLLEHLDKTLFGDGRNAPPSHVIAEYAAHSAAAEFMFPYPDRLAIISAGRQANIIGIAKEYDIPASIVDHYLTASAMDFYAFP